ncbi:hypothetical protein VTK26DRAFT_6094 [Humicola hyalothermophila]
MRVRVVVALLAVPVSLAAAAVPNPKRFDLTKPSYDLRHKTLAQGTVQQGVAFDNLDRRLFIAQHRAGTDSKFGHLTIGQVDFKGNYLSHMKLNDFGRGDQGRLLQACSPTSSSRPPRPRPRTSGPSTASTFTCCGLASDSKVVTLQLAAVYLNTGKAVQGPVLTKAGSTLSYREAGGMAIYKTKAGEVRLFPGFTCEEFGLPEVEFVLLN